jgi:TatD DNase family protein
MKLIDTHSHLYLDDFRQDFPEVMNRLRENQVEKVFLPNIDSSSINEMLKLETDYPEIFFPMMGLHPSSVQENYEEELQLVDKWLQKKQFIAIGEIGIDLYWDDTYFNQQVEAFRTQINWAKKLKLPIVIHARNSFNEIFDVVDEEKDENLTGVFHSFSGTYEQAQHIIDLGFKIGINGIVTFKNSSLDDVVKQIDINHLVLETDSPFLSPEPKRGKRNESSHVLYIAEKIAKIKNLSISEVGEITTENAKTLFNIKSE